MEHGNEKPSTQTEDAEKKPKVLPVFEKLAWTEFEVSSLFGTPVGTLRNWRSQKKGPKYFKVGSRVYYRPIDTQIFYFSCPVLTIDSRE